MGSGKIRVSGPDVKINCSKIHDRLNEGVR